MTDDAKTYIEIWFFKRSMIFHGRRSTLSGHEKLAFICEKIRVFDATDFHGVATKPVGQDMWTARLTLQGVGLLAPLTGSIGGYAEDAEPDKAIEKASEDLVERMVRVRRMTEALAPRWRLDRL